LWGRSGFRGHTQARGWGPSGSPPIKKKKGRLGGGGAHCPLDMGGGGGPGGVRGVGCHSDPAKDVKILRCGWVGGGGGGLILTCVPGLNWVGLGGVGDRSRGYNPWGFS